MTLADLLYSVDNVMATVVVHPCDVIKVRLQLNSDVGGKQLLAHIGRKEGLKVFYTGLSAGLARQVCYTSSRLGVYYWLYDHHKKLYGKTPQLTGKVRYGVFAAMIGAFVGCPADLVHVRMMADGNFGTSQRYSGLRDAFTKISREEGVCALWRGAGLTLARAVCFSVAQMETYSHLRRLAEPRLAGGFRLHLCTSLLASLVSAVVTLPVDLVKTRYQVLSEHVSPYDIAKQCLRENGYLGFWRGFIPYYIRLSGHTIITFYLFEIFHKCYHERFSNHDVRASAK